MQRPALPLPPQQHGESQANQAWARLPLPTVWLLQGIIDAGVTDSIVRVGSTFKTDPKLLVGVVGAQPHCSPVPASTLLNTCNHNAANAALCRRSNEGCPWLAATKCISAFSCAVLAVRHTLRTAYTATTVMLLQA